MIFTLFDEEDTLVRPSVLQLLKDQCIHSVGFGEKLLSVSWIVAPKVADERSHKTSMWKKQGSAKQFTAMQFIFF